VCIGVTGRHHQFSSASEAIKDRKPDTSEAIKDRKPDTPTREYPTPAQAAAASGSQTRR